MAFIDYLLSDQYGDDEEATMAYLTSTPKKTAISSLKKNAGFQFGWPSVDLPSTSGPAEEIFPEESQPKQSEPSTPIVFDPQFQAPEITLPTAPEIPAVLKDVGLPEMDLPILKDIVSKIPEVKAEIPNAPDISSLVDPITSKLTPQIGIPDILKTGLGQVDLDLDIPDVGLGDFKKVAEEAIPGMKLKDGKINFEPSTQQKLKIGAEIGSLIEKAPIEAISQFGGVLKDIFSVGGDVFGNVTKFLGGVGAAFAPFLMTVSIAQFAADLLGFNKSNAGAAERFDRNISAWEREGGRNLKVAVQSALFSGYSSKYAKYAKDYLKDNPKALPEFIFQISVGQASRSEEGKLLSKSMEKSLGKETFTKLKSLASQQLSKNGVVDKFGYTWSKDSTPKEKATVKPVDSKPVEKKQAAEDQPQWFIDHMKATGGYKDKRGLWWSKGAGPGQGN